MRGFPFRVFLVLAGLLGGCGLSKVGPDLDAWQAHQASLAAKDSTDSKAETAADTGSGSGPGSGSDAGSDSGFDADSGSETGSETGSDSDSATQSELSDAEDGDAVSFDDVDVLNDAQADSIDAANDASDAAQPEVTIDVVQVEVGPACKTEGDCPPPPDSCQIRECAQGFCKFSPKPCPAPSDECDLSACATSTGLCTFGAVPAGTFCDDKSPCSKKSACDGAGACVGGDKAGCDDGNPCTFDECVLIAASTQCSSGPAVAKNCDDGNACTADSCNVNKCENVPMTGGEACSDGNACTDGDFCAVGKCAAGPLKDCGVSTICKPATCEPTTGCNVPVDGAPDGTVCKQPGGVCSSGSCIQGWASSLAAGPGHACAWGTQESIACWGSNKTLAIGEATIPDQIKPSFSSSNLAPVRNVAVGDGFTCRVHVGVQSVFCRGDNDHGQLGKAAGPASAADVVTSLAFDLTQVVAGDDHVCVLSSAGTASCWGAGKAGQLGKSGQVTDAAAPVEVTFAGSFTALAAGGSNTCGLVDGEAYCWGSNGVAWAHPGPPSPKPGVPAAVKVNQTFTALAVGENHACGLTKTGDVWCWGKNDSFQLGATDQLATQAKLPLANLQSVAVGSKHTCVVSIAGAVSCFGSNSHLQKGPGSNAVPGDPNLAFMTKAKAVSAAGNATCVLMGNQSVQCFGVGADGNPTLPYTVPGSVGLKLD